MTRLLLAAALSLVAAPLVAQGAAAPAPKIDPSWLSWDAATSTAKLQVTAGLTGTNGALNFDGFADGELVATVPANAKIVMNFYNHDGMLPHSAIVLPYPTDGKLPNDGSGTPAIQRAYTAKTVEGLPPEAKDVTRFTAAPPGKYMIYCGVPGHGPSGMWITFVVSADAKTATLTYEPKKKK